MADYLLTSLNDSKITEKFNALLEKHCPQTHAQQRKKPESLKEIDASTAKLLDEIDDILTEDSKLVGEATHSLNMMIDAAEKGNWDPIRKNIMKIQNMPPAVLMPSWMAQADIHYFWKEKIPPARSELKELPERCYMQVDGVTLEQVKAWQDELKRGGLPCRWSGEKNNKYYISYEAGNSKFNVIWDNNKVMVLMDENPVIFIPKLYLSFLPGLK